MSLTLGHVIDGKYRVERVLGKGGMGVVYAAQHLVLGERFAIKVLSDTTDAVLRERFLREARAAAQLRSTHVVRVIDLGTLPGGEPFMVMELLEGHDLDALVASEGPRTVPEAVAYLLQACDALCEAHARGIVHRDIKPANLFLCRRPGSKPIIKLLDFGIAKVEARALSTELTAADSLLGSPHFMAPEQLVSSRDVDARADIWSLGATLFELLGGDVPFDGPGLPDVFASVVRDPPRSLRTLAPHVPVELERVVLRCLAKDPADRFGSVEELAAELRRFETPAAVPQRSPAVPSRLVTTLIELPPNIQAWPATHQPRPWQPTPPMIHAHAYQPRRDPLTTLAWIAVGGALMLMFVCGAAFFVLRANTVSGSSMSESSEPPLAASSFEEDLPAVDKALTEAERGDVRRWLGEAERLRDAQPQSALHPTTLVIELIKSKPSWSDAARESRYGARAAAIAGTIHSRLAEVGGAEYVLFETSFHDAQLFDPRYRECVVKDYIAGYLHIAARTGVTSLKETARSTLKNALANNLPQTCRDQLLALEPQVR